MNWSLHFSIHIGNLMTTRSSRELFTWQIDYDWYIVLWWNVSNFTYKNDGQREHLIRKTKIKNLLEGIVRNSAYANTYKWKLIDFVEPWPLCVDAIL